MSDIEDHSQAEEEFNKLVGAVPQHIVVLDGEGRRVYANQVALNFHGLTLDEFMRKETVERCFHPEDVKRYLENCGMTMPVKVKV